MSFDDSNGAVFMVYRVFGLVPFQFHLKTISNPQNTILNQKRQKWNFLVETLYFVCIIASELCMLVYYCIFCYRSSLIFSLNPLNASHLVIVFTLRAFIVVTTVETYLKRDVQVKILFNLCDIDRVFVEKLNLTINYERLRRQILNAFLEWTFILVILISTFIILTFISTDTNLYAFNL